VPVNPKVGERELAHIVGDSDPAAVLAAPDATLPAALDALPRLDVEVAPGGERGGGDEPRLPDEPVLPDEPDPEAPALIVYTSGTTGPPKGVVLPRRAIAANLDALADAWDWTERDVLTHGLPLFHVHGLVIGVLGPLRRGGTLHHLGGFSVEGVTGELGGGDATMLFGVPTMYHRLADAAAEDASVADALGRARLLVSGSAALSSTDHQRIERASGQRVVERYGMTETLMICSVRADGDRRAGTVGRPLPGVELRLVGEDGESIATSDGEAVGEVQVRGASLFLEYLNRPEATAEAFTEGWFKTGDVATREPDGYIRLIGRQSTDLIKSGGFKIGAGEIEIALAEHPGVQEVAITGEPDPDLGERVVAWVVPAADPPPSERELADHVAKLLTPHKRPRVVHYLDALPRNELGKVMKKALADGPRAS
jgi:malonyl-CoA/methylmalonyl-CoA synthetase